MKIEIEHEGSCLVQRAEPNSIRGNGTLRWMGVERAMGIEPTGKALPELENKRFRANANAKCD
jgi:hypothetical protein